MSYYYLVSALPALPAKGKAFHFAKSEVLDLISGNLSDADYLQFQLLLLQNDLKLLVNLLLTEWEQEVIHFLEGVPMAYLSGDESSFNKALAKLPEPFNTSIGIIKDKQDQHNILLFEKAVLEVYYNYAIARSGEFLRDYLSYEHTLKSLITAFQLSSFEKNVEEQLYIANYDDEQLSKKRWSEFEKSSGLLLVNQLQDTLAKDDPETVSTWVNELLKAKVDELSMGLYFRLENVLTYWIKLQLLPVYLNVEVKDPLEKEAEAILQFTLKET